MFLSQALFLNWFEKIQPSFVDDQSKKNQLKTSFSQLQVEKIQPSFVDDQRNKRIKN